MCWMCGEKINFAFLDLMAAHSKRMPETKKRRRYSGTDREQSQSTKDN